MGKRLLLVVLVVLSGCKGHTQEKENKKKAEKETTFKVNKTDAEWRAELTDMEYQVLRKAATEHAFSSDLLDNKQKGTYVCAGCGTPLFKSEHKFDSGTGWPSFDREIKGNVAYSVDYKIGMARTEEHCAVCGGHLGHVFDDGPRKTTGKRHCINGAALDFIPDGN
ncbi:peptide-methionine (R)-S-oxide reductase [Flagellimonas taeanensis]|jgi:peptide-methionine (R)-S-oxide reductase|uniref:peptide-methionine (R)-S-oxide reductase n=1 Tax=Flagellimonas taeanensis TaxID=1005926 RepID=A0A1M7CDV0_9FLAO|nr:MULTISPECIES: peptide-methionine (R)-S-oxide reductase MsrB [Allomuricauda]MDC6386943.1 peptide-methionine (R)-S-oxide reductase MsrB [Muricauda sp. SK9]RIV50561.1 peptide-methionine (R)-S-oxide reductase [Allomuricauda taeanensis]SFC62156.1 peptide-methionine (R)-S-oxide reductase [Allomuricauda taeanensis]SHL65360.1 peptide-methionine (R)-S-oxide reductase [Allomuricauda taeanensis]